MFDFELFIFEVEGLGKTYSTIISLIIHSILQHFLNYQNKVC